jgi:hypothetical protein
MQKLQTTKLPKSSKEKRHCCGGIVVEAGFIGKVYQRGARPGRSRKPTRVKKGLEIELERFVLESDSCQRSHKSCNELGA